MPFADIIALFVPPLNAQGVSYAVVGGVATIIYSAPRLTNDIDLVVALPGASIPELLAAFTSDDFFVPPPSGGHFNIIHLLSAQKADFYPAGNDPLDAMALERCQRHLVGGHILRVAPPEVIVVRKLEWYRDGGADRHRGHAPAARLMARHCGRYGLWTRWRGTCQALGRTVARGNGGETGGGPRRSAGGVRAERRRERAGPRPRAPATPAPPVRGVRCPVRGPDCL